MSITTIAKYSPIEAGLAALREKHHNVVVDVTTAEGLAKAKEGRSELKAVRLNLDKARKEEKEESLAYGRLVDSEAKRILEVIQPWELNYDRAIKAEEARKEEEKQAKLKAEREAEMAKLRAEVEEQERIKREEREAEEKRLAEIRAEEERKFAEEKAKLDTERERLAKIHEEQEAKAREEREALAAEKAKFENEQRIIRERLDKEKEELRLKQDAEEKAAAQKRAEEEAKESAKKNEEARIKSILENIDSIKDLTSNNYDLPLISLKHNLETLKRVIVDESYGEYREMAAKERQTSIDSLALKIKSIEDTLAKNREIERQNNMKLEAREMLEVFVLKYGAIPEFEDIGKEIETFLSIHKRSEQ